MDAIQPEITDFTDGQETVTTNLPGIAEILFSRPPQDPRTIELGLEDLSVDQSDSSTPLKIIRLLSLLGMEKLFGHDDPMRLSEQDYTLLRKYIQSLGYDIKVYCNDGLKDPWEVVRTEGPSAIQEVRIKYMPLEF